MGWQYGSLAKSATSPEPEPEGADVATLLDQAEDIVNAAAPEIFAEFDKEQEEPRGVPPEGQRQEQGQEEALSLAPGWVGQRGCERRDSNPQVPKNTRS